MTCFVTYRAVTKFMSCFHAQAASLTNVSSESGVLAKKLSKKRNEELNVTMCWLRTKIGFLCQRAALLCVRGSRTPWYKENTKAVSEDFRLTVHEADLDLRIRIKIYNNASLGISIQNCH